jgi:hypothetical protein
MTPQEKASQLVFDMEQRIEQACNQSSRQSHNSAAKQCALLAVEQMLSLPVFWDGTSEGESQEGDDNYWVSVKDEILQM